MTPEMAEYLAQEYASRALYASLHTSDPGSTGAGELVAAGRQALTWSSGSVDGEIVTAEITFSLAAPADVTHVGIWGSSGGTDFLDSYANAIPLEIGDYVINLKYVQT